MTTPTQVIDISSEAGKNFVKNVNTLKRELNINKTGEKVCQIKSLTLEQIENNPFLKDFMNGSDVFKNLEIRNISIGNFGRKGGWTYKPIQDNHFRFIIHFGPPEIYYLDDDKHKDKMYPMTDGQGFIISAITAPESYVSVYSDPIRIIHNPKIQAIIPKIRPRNYQRTTLVYDFHYNIPEEENDEIENIEKEVDENIEKDENEKNEENNGEENNNSE